MNDQIARIGITPNDIKPVIWRGIEAHIADSLKTLHLAIRALMPFENYHLFRFDVGEASYGIALDDDYMDLPTRDAGNLRLAKLAECGIADFTFTYGFGDDWCRDIVIEAVLPDHLSADCFYRFVDGEHRAPPMKSAGRRGSTSFSTPWQSRTSPNTSLCCNGTGDPSIQTISAGTISAPNGNTRQTPRRRQSCTRQQKALTIKVPLRLRPLVLNGLAEEGGNDLRLAGARAADQHDMRRHPYTRRARTDVDPRGDAPGHDLIAKPAGHTASQKPACHNARAIVRK